MKMTYRRLSSSAEIITRYSEDGAEREHVLTNCEDAVIYPIQHTGRPSLIRTGILLERVDKQNITAHVSLLSSITDSTGLILLNPLITATDEELVLRIANLARNVQTIPANSMLAVLSVFTLNDTVDLVEAKAAQKRTTRIKKGR